MIGFVISRMFDWDLGKITDFAVQTGFDGIGLCILGSL